MKTLSSPLLAPARGPALSFTPFTRPFTLLLALFLAPLLALAQTPATAVVGLREVELTYPAEAVLEAVQQATVAAQVQGRILDVRVDVGARVKAGEVLMKIDAREAAQNLAGAQAQLVNARANFERTRNLYQQKFLSQAAFDKAEADFRSAKAAAGQAGAAASYATITSPIAGIVAQRLVEAGDMATPGRPLISIFDPKALRAVASIPQYKLDVVEHTPRAKLEFPETGRWVDAARVELLPTADPQTHVVTARVYLPENLPGALPGMFVRVHFVVGRAQKLLVPAAAVLHRGEVTAVYVVDDQDHLHLRQVRLGEAYAGGDREVLAGLSAGERVALDPIAASIGQNK